MPHPVPQTISVITLGCKTNQCDSEEIARDLIRAGHRVEMGEPTDDTTHSPLPPASGPQPPAHLFVVNTCTVTGTADAKARKLVRKLLREHPGTTVIATGCYAERAAKELQRLGAVVVPRSEQAQLADVVSRRAPRPPAESGDSALRLSGTRTRAFLKVQDGCSHACTYCIVHTVRGPLRSMPVEVAVAEVARLVAAGRAEVVLCGIHLGAYGVDLPGAESLATLLRALRDVPVRRLRLSSVEPMDVSDELIGELADHPWLCHHLHLPLQSGDDTVLRGMGRGYRVADYERIVERVRSCWPDLSLTSDMMVGFPGETDEAFGNTLATARRLAFSRIHVFRYSPRPGTPAAARADHVAEGVKRRRGEQLHRLGDELFRSYAARWIGETVEVLFEQRNRRTGRWEGMTSHYLRIEAHSTAPIAGLVRPVRIERIGADCLVGAVCEEST